MPAVVPPSFKKIVATKLSTNFREAIAIVDGSISDALKPTQLVVRNVFVGINASDVNFTAGAYKPDVKPPFDCGFEAVGEVVQVGAADHGYSVGDFVVTQSYGSFAEYQVVSVRTTKRVPSLRKEWLPLDLSGTTASIALEHVAAPQKGEVALVTAAAGGTGHFAVQLLKHVYGCRVIGTCSSPAKEEFLKSIGCDETINYKKERISSALKRISPTGVNLVYESVGGQQFEDALNALAIKGRMVTIGSVSGYVDGQSWGKNAEASEKPYVPIPSRLLWKSASLRSFFLPHYGKYVPAHFSKLCELVEKDVIKSCVDPTSFKGLESVNDAVDYMYSGKNQGKIVVEL